MRSGNITSQPQGKSICKGCLRSHIHLQGSQSEVYSNSLRFWYCSVCSTELPSTDLCLLQTQIWKLLCLTGPLNSSYTLIGHVSHPLYWFGPEAQMPACFMEDYTWIPQRENWYADGLEDSEAQGLENGRDLSWDFFYILLKLKLRAHFWCQT